MFRSIALRDLWQIQARCRNLMPLKCPKKSHTKNNLTRGDVTTFVIVRNEDFQMAIPVDELMGQQLVLLRPLRGVMSKIRDLSGVALLAGGEVGMVLAVNRLLAA